MMQSQKNTRSGSECATCSNSCHVQAYRSMPIHKLRRFRKSTNGFVRDGFRYSVSGNGELRREDGRKVSADFIAVFGDVFAYWVEQNRPPEALVFCSYACAVQCARTTRSLLVRGTDGLFVTPEQEEFDDYAREHDIKHHLLQIRDWASPQEELRAYLDAQVFPVRRALKLVTVVIDSGEITLAERVVRAVVESCPLDEVYDLAAFAFWRLGEPGEAAAIYERVCKNRGGEDRMSAGDLAAWAMLALSAGATDRALCLSERAVSMAPTRDSVIVCRLAVLDNTSPAEGMRFLSEHSLSLKSAAAFYNAALVCRASQDYTAAEEYLRMALCFGTDPAVLMYLGEVLLYAGRYDEALAQARCGLKALESFSLGGLTGFDGRPILSYGYPYPERKRVRKMLLLVEGKALYHLGEMTAGQERLRDAIDINLNYELKEALLADVQEYVEGYAPRSEVERDRDSLSTRLLEKVNDQSRLEVEADRLRGTIDAISDLQASWSDALKTLKTEASAEMVAEEFSARIRAFTALVRSSEVVQYNMLRSVHRSCYPNLTDRVIEQLTNADYLFKTLREERLPVFAGVLIELCKAAESVVNDVLLDPFVRKQLRTGLRPVVFKWEARSGRPIVIEGSYRDQPRRLMLGEIVLLLQGADTAWQRYVSAEFAESVRWIRHDLPLFMSVLKDRYRNGCAHYSSASRDRVAELNSALSEMMFFGRFDKMAASVHGEVRTSRRA